MFVVYTARPRQTWFSACRLAFTLGLSPGGRPFCEERPGSDWAESVSRDGGYPYWGLPSGLCPEVPGLSYYPGVWYLKVFTLLSYRYHSSYP